MLYVQQSLSPSEKIVHIGRFHWAYKLGAITWIILGVVMAYFVYHIAYGFEISFHIRSAYPNLPPHLEGQAWQAVTERKGGVFNIIRNMNIGIHIGAFIALLIGLFFGVKMFIEMTVTEICVTNSRMIYKTGLIARYVGEISVDRIEGIQVIQSILGRLFGYGRLIVRGMGVGEVATPPIANPITFRRAIEKAKSLEEKQDRSDDI